MSADNGIYILLTETEEGESEYRVSYANAIDNIYGNWNPDTGLYPGDIKAIQSTFSDSPVFKTLEEALDFSELEAHNYEYLEDGISIISDFKHLGFLFKNGG